MTIPQASIPAHWPQQMAYAARIAKDQGWPCCPTRATADLLEQGGTLYALRWLVPDGDAKTMKCTVVLTNCETGGRTEYLVIRREIMRGGQTTVRYSVPDHGTYPNREAVNAALLNLAAPTRAAGQPTPRPERRGAAKRCAHCRRELDSGEGYTIPFIGVVGPECRKKYASLLRALEQVNGLQAFEYDQGTVNLAHHVIRDLRRIGVAVDVVAVQADVLEVRIKGLSKQAKVTLEGWKDIQARFEQRLRDAQAERGGVAA